MCSQEGDFSHFSDIFIVTEMMDTDLDQVRDPRKTLHPELIHSTLLPSHHDDAP